MVKKVEELDVGGAQKVDAFLPQLKPQAISNDFLMLTTNNSFIKFWVESHILGLIKQALSSLYGTEFNVQIEVDQTEDADTEYTSESYIAANLVSSNTKLDTDPSNVFTSQNSEEEASPATPNFDMNLTNLLTFENFVIGSSNNMAFQMARSVAETPGKPNLNPLFIYGKSGVGKTHLLHAIKNYININNPAINVVYIDATAFVNEYTAASAAHDVDKSSFINFNKKYESAQVLLIDDLQLLQDKVATLNTFFTLFNNITNLGRQIVISADRAPKNIDVDERYQSRFNNGMSCEITSPEVEVKLGIIKSYIDDFKKEEPEVENYISDDVVNFIAQNSSSNIRELKSAVTKVLYEIKYNHENIPVDKVKEILEEHFSKNIKKRVTVENIQKVCEEYYGVSHNALVGKKKDRNIAFARQISMYLCYKMLEISVTAIGKSFNRDHSTVLHSIKVIEDKLKNNIEISGEIELLEKRVLERD
ncbi:MAG: chromosomal replication initiator protein DnaA [Coriobacteriia bacterium]|nr:chromosomal replication initiator protein DnaA [Coriobacteriia bacterium]